MFPSFTVEWLNNIHEFKIYSFFAKKLNKFYYFYINYVVFVDESLIFIQ